MDYKCTDGIVRKRNGSVQSMECKIVPYGAVSLGREIRLRSAASSEEEVRDLMSRMSVVGVVRPDANVLTIDQRPRLDDSYKILMPIGVIAACAGLLLLALKASSSQ